MIGEMVRTMGHTLLGSLLVTQYEKARKHKLTKTEKRYLERIAKIVWETTRKCRTHKGATGKIRSWLRRNTDENMPVEKQFYRAVAISTAIDIMFDLGPATDTWENYISRICFLVSVPYYRNARIETLEVVSNTFLLMKR